MSKQQDTNKQESLPQEETAELTDELTDELLEAVAGGGFSETAALTLSMFGGHGGAIGGLSATGSSAATGGQGGGLTTGTFKNYNHNSTYSNSTNQVEIIKAR